MGVRDDVRSGERDDVMRGEVRGVRYLTPSTPTERVGVMGET